MVTLEQVREYLKELADQDKLRRRVQASGETLEDALNQASIELGVRIRDLEYEVLEKGSKGALGWGKKPWVIIAYEALKAQEKEQAEESLEMDFGFGEEHRSENQDGKVCVRLTPEGVSLKVSPPTGNGKRVTEREAIDKVNRRYGGRFDTGMVAKVVKYADDEWVKIADYMYNPANDPMMSVDIIDAEMRALLTLHPPGAGGADPTFDAMVEFIQRNGVIHGIKEEAIRELEEDPQYGVPILVAEGTKPKNGRDAYIVYSFERNTSQVKLKEKNGRVDFKELNLIQNVVEGQVLARKIPPERGESGRTVTGKLLPAKDGKDCEIPIGKNVRLSEDGASAIAEINGQVVITGDKINVEPIYVVEGDVNLKTGNILFLGTVMVKGNVEDGFSVKAAGNIEVMGSVGKCDLDAEGDIIVHQGITGKTTGKVLSGHSVFARFIENATVEAAENVVVSDGIINSNIIANKKIICKGKRAAIVGGHLRASEEINAKILGSVSGSETILEVGYDPKSKERMDVLNKRREELLKELEDLNLNLSTLVNLKKMKKDLPEEKERYYQELINRKKEIDEELESIKTETEELKNYLSQLKISGKICSSSTVFPGVKIYIKDAFLEVKNEFKGVTFIAEGNLVKVTKYEEPEDEEILKR
ncbi:MAG: FapA family protein [Spirochaetales bacterium]